VPAENGTISIHFCPWEDCAGILAAFIASENDVVCALYGLSEPAVVEALRASGARLVVDHGAAKLPFPAREFKKAGLMHNKFCATRDAVVTGSYNPTKGTAANALLVIRSARLARAYRTEFEELWHGMERGRTTRNPRTLIGGTVVTAAFCPDDDCQALVLEALRGAQTRIRFMLYSFTDDAIGTLLLRKAAEGIAIEGLLDASQVSTHSEAKRLGKHAVITKGVHHKTFIIDNTTVITGSYNPTWSGTAKNDENLLVIRDEAVAAAFIAEYERLRQGIRPA
jgi:phosphatidylserine/phosphatidylglycerophosphate/cardiolipin synthase-like enzyme